MELIFICLHAVIAGLILSKFNLLSLGGCCMYNGCFKVVMSTMSTFSGSIFSIP